MGHRQQLSMPPMPNAAGGETSLNDLLKTGSPVIMTVCDSSGRKYADKWVAELKREAPDTTLFVGVAELQSVPMILRAPAKRFLRAITANAEKSILLLDWSGHFRVVYQSCSDRVLLMVLNSSGEVALQRSCADPQKEILDDIIRQLNTSNTAGTTFPA